MSAAGRRGKMQRQLGFTLVELMVGLVLGLLISAAAISLFVTNGRTLEATESLSRIQENVRLGFELMARDIREAGGNACGKNLLVANVLNNRTTDWWAAWNNSVRGYDNTAAFGDSGFGTSAGQRVTGTDAIELKSGLSGAYTVEEHQPTSAQFKVNAAGHDIADSDIVMVCDFKQAAIMQVTNANPSNRTIVHNTGAGTPGNCSKGLGFKNPMSCTTNGSAYTYGPNSQLSRLRAVRWYVGNNGRGGRSLYLGALRNNGGTLSIAAEEVIEGVTDLQLEYLLVGANAYVAASSVAATAWSDVQSVRVNLTIAGGQGSDAARQRVGTDGNALQRKVSHIVAIRNRMP